MPKIGAHISSAKQLHLAFPRAKRIDAECLQIFISPPQQWREPLHLMTEIKEFKQAQEASGIGPNFIHANYLINLATIVPKNLEKSISWLTYALNTAFDLEMTGVIVHTGSSGNRKFADVLPQITKSIKTILKNTQPRGTFDTLAPLLILETASGAGAVIGDKFYELGAILKAVNSPRLKVCLDTQHVFASGYQIQNQKGLNRMLGQFSQQIGLENLAVIHCNDSKTNLGSRKDRHENIGEGKIGIDAFSDLINHPLLKAIPFILEVPGENKKGPDLKNVQILKSLLNSK